MTDYITLQGFKNRHGITNTTHDVRIADHCTAASREVDSICGRQFGQVFALDDDEEIGIVRYFRPDTCELVRIDDAYDIEEVALDTADLGTYTNVLTVNTDYITEPTDGVGPNSQTGWPASAIRLVSYAQHFSSLRRPSVKVTAKWGWSAVPADVVEATYLIANRLFFEVSVPSGIVPGGIDFPGSPLQRPYTVERLLAPYVRSEKSIGVAG